MYSKLNNTINDMFLSIEKNYPIASTLDERQQYFTLVNIINDINYISKALINQYDISKAPNEVYIFDTSRLMFWKINQYGYTNYIKEAGLYNLKDAMDICNSSIDNKIVYFYE